MKSSSILWAISLLLILLVIPVVTPVRGSESDVTYATMTIYVEASYIGGLYGAYASLKIEVPRYLLVDRENEIKVMLDRSACLNGVQIAVSIVGKISTASGEKEIALGGANFDFGCSTSSRQVITIKVVISRGVYKESATKTIVVYAKDVSGYGIPFMRATIISNNPAEAILVLGVPVPQVSIAGLGGGALYLKIGETKSFTVSVTSLNAPTLINDIKIVVPNFAMAYVNTPLPLNIGVNETRSIVIAVKGSSPGAGVVRVDIVYYDGAENKELALYVPVVVEEERIYSLIDEYNKQIQQIQSKLLQLEAELGIKVSEASSLSQRLDAVINTLNNLEKQYSTLVNEAQTLTTKYQVLEQSVQDLAKSLQVLNSDAQRRFQEIDNHIQDLANETRNNVLSISSEISRLSNKVSELEHSLSSLRIVLMIVAVVAIVCAIWIIIRKI